LSTIKRFRFLLELAGMIAGVSWYDCWFQLVLQPVAIFEYGFMELKKIK